MSRPFYLYDGHVIIHNCHYYALSSGIAKDLKSVSLCIQILHSVQNDNM